MSYGPLEKCYRCKTKLDINDPANGGYCGGHFCLLDPDRPKSARALEPSTAGPALTNHPPAPRPAGSRKERRAAAAKARQKKGRR